ncbi:hypothetical protein [Borreliella mayonii]|nr:hypothetical protein [Borreliella mayonii]
MKIYFYYFFFNFNFLYSNSFETLNVEYDNILENYYSGDIDSRLF